ncbi:MAG TPA: Maf family nucleotide pyrophosphatase [Cytophagaceae bacterium]|jgi:septum formation protein|nr:Maf family nucleotide pyrophosphatase [Cytophagaceae bacterium]
MYQIILASQSPRRRQILKDAGISFESKVKDTNEDFPSSLPKQEVPVYLANKKATAFIKELKENELLITADTVVIIKNEILNKPRDKGEAMQMLQKISGTMHEVVTGVCLTSLHKQISFSDLTKVYFLPLSSKDIEYYIDNYKPFDKAGSYGIQEYIGHIGIEKIEGSYFNVMGLPIHKVIQHLRAF